MNTNNDELLRANFEAWAVQRLKQEDCTDEYCFLMLQKNEFDEYHTTYVQGQWEGYQAAHKAQQAAIDRLMLEFCPDEMTAEQVATWGASQKRSTGEQE